MQRAARESRGGGGVVVLVAAKEGRRGVGAANGSWAGLAESEAQRGFE